MRSIELLAQNISNLLHTDIVLAEIRDDHDEIMDLRESLDLVYTADKSSLMDFVHDIAYGGLDTIVRESLLIRIDEMARNMPSIGEGIFA